MLIHIDIKNLATIHSLQLEMNQGTTVMTGETGAGKSIVIGAIGLALGQRASGDMVRAGQEKADISLSFDTSALPEAKKWLREYDLDDDSGTCIIRRTLHKDGRSRSFVNGSPVTLPILRELGDTFMHVHGQHEHQALFKPELQAHMLDRYAHHTDLLADVTRLATHWQEINADINTLATSDQERRARCELLRFQCQELQALDVKPQEFTRLESEHKQLAHADELLQHLQTANRLLHEQDEHNVRASMNHILHALDSVKNVDPAIGGWMETLHNASILLADVETDIQRYLDHVEMDPERLQQLEDRISVLFDIARKHRVAPEELYDFYQHLAQELLDLDNHDERLQQLEAKRDQILQQYQKAALKLSASRKKSAVKLEKEITQLIHDIALPHGQFKISFIPHESATPSKQGLEKIQFMIATNLGQAMLPLAKVASGGELSRISLAIHVATAEQHTIPTLIFDEVDVGISGGTAEMVGKLLRRLGQSHQLLCITHLPQVAVQGHQHWLVEKQHENNATFSRVRTLNAKDKIQELARLLGGVNITQTTVKHAKEMLEAVE